MTVSGSDVLALSTRMHNNRRSIDPGESKIASESHDIVETVRAGQTMFRIALEPPRSSSNQLCYNSLNELDRFGQ